jgi:hypothetical protein
LIFRHFSERRISKHSFCYNFFHRLWLLAVVGVPDVPDVSCAAVDFAVGDVLTAIDVSGVPAVARVFSVDVIPAAIYVTSVTRVSTVSGALAVVGAAVFGSWCSALLL